MPDGASFPTRALPRSVVLMLAALFGFVLIRTAWMSDDGMITLRSVLNVTHGFGLTFNIDERVQSFTHPLWLGLLTLVYLAVANVYTAAFALSMAASIAAFWLIVSRAASGVQAWLAAGILIFSRAFVDFSTSGLENPLSHVLVAVAAGLFADTRMDRGRRLTALWFVTSLLYLTRPDAVLIVLPLVLVASATDRRPGPIIRAAALGLTPAVLWTTFSLVYYGFPFPNTAYAKLAEGIRASELWHQGIFYLIDSIDRDPLSLATVALATVLAWTRRDALGRALTVGAACYLVYVVSIGGDFMTGRFITLPLVAAVAAIARTPKTSRVEWAAAAVLLTATAVGAGHIPIFSDSRYADAEIKPNGTVDERAFYFKNQGLTRATRQTFEEPDWPFADGTAHRLNVVDTCGGLGALGLQWGPYTHVLDTCALADPLLARLPSAWNEDWRAGHFRRMIPDGYRESLESDTNRLTDQWLAAYDDDLRLVTRSPRLFTRDRLRAIVRLNRGTDDRLINRRYYRYEGSIADVTDLTNVKPNGTPDDAAGVRRLTLPLAITCTDRAGRRYFDVSLDSNDRYRVTFLKADASMGWIDLGPIPAFRRQPGLVSYTADIPPRAAASGFDTVVVSPAEGEEPYALGHFLLDGVPVTDPELHARVAARDRR